MMKMEPKKIPWAEKYKALIKPKFEERYRELLGERYREFIEYSLSFQTESFRINTLKISNEKEAEILTKFKEKFKLERIPWYEHGYLYEGERRDIGNTKEHVLGYIYVQEAASMIPPIVLNPNEEDVVLDIAAAPGSKTTLLSALMNNKGMIVANDSDFQRVKALSSNIQRMGAVNIITTNMNGLNVKGRFSKILVDAPCSGTGTIRKSLKTITMWNPHAVKRLAKLQRKLIEHAFNLLEDGGTLVYSTCTLEPEEDEGTVDYLIKRFDNAKLESIKLNIKSSEPVVEFNGNRYDDEVKKCLRIWPQDNNTDGFFVAKIRKL